MPVKYNNYIRISCYCGGLTPPSTPQVLTSFSIYFSTSFCNSLRPTVAVWKTTPVPPVTLTIPVLVTYRIKYSPIGKS
jgi:hypothetical protein